MAKTFSATPFAAEVELCQACARGDEAALASLETYFARCRQRLTRKFSADEVDEALQQVRVTLLVREGGQTPRIAQYRGDGKLEKWLAIAATRHLLRNEGKRANPVLARLGEEVSTSLSAPYLPVINEALASAWNELSSRGRALLHQQYALSLGIDRIGHHYEVSRATAARWVAQARNELVERVRSKLAVELSARPAEVDSMLRSLRDALELELGEG